MIALQLSVTCKWMSSLLGQDVMPPLLRGSMDSFTLWHLPTTTNSQVPMLRCTICCLSWHSSCSWQWRRRQLTRTADQLIS